MEATQRTIVSEAKNFRLRRSRLNKTRLSYKIGWIIQDYFNLLIHDTEQTGALDNISLETLVKKGPNARKYIALFGVQIFWPIVRSELHLIRSEFQANQFDKLCKDRIDAGVQAVLKEVGFYVRSVKIFQGPMKGYPTQACIPPRGAPPIVFTQYCMQSCNHTQDTTWYDQLIIYEFHPRNLHIITPKVTSQNGYNSNSFHGTLQHRPKHGLKRFVIKQRWEPQSTRFSSCQYKCGNSKQFYDTMHTYRDPDQIIPIEICANMDFPQWQHQYLLIDTQNCRGRQVQFCDDDGNVGNFKFNYRFEGLRLRIYTYTTAIPYGQEQSMHFQGRCQRPFEHLFSFNVKDVPNE